MKKYFLVFTLTFFTLISFSSFVNVKNLSAGATCCKSADYPSCTSDATSECQACDEVVTQRKKNNTCSGDPNSACEPGNGNTPGCITCPVGWVPNACGGSPDPCGDSFCDSGAGENCTSCSTDCGGCPSCTVDINPPIDPADVVFGEVTEFGAGISTSNTVVSRVWTLSELIPVAFDTIIGKLVPPVTGVFVENSPPNTKNGQKAWIVGTDTWGEDKLGFRAVVRNATGDTRACTATKILTVVPPMPWWKITGAGDVSVGDNDIANQNAIVRSTIPRSCSVEPSCNDNFIEADSHSGTPGIVIAPGNSIFSTLTGDGKSNANEWVAKSYSTGPVTDSSFFFNIAKSKNVWDLKSDSFFNDPFLVNDDIDRAVANWVDDSDVTWLSQQGDLIMRNILIKGEKVIILIECGDLEIGFSKPGIGRLRVDDPSSDFIMIIVGECGGVGGDVTIRENVDELDVVIIADGTITTSTIADCAGSPAKADDQLHMRGSFAANEGITLQRDLCEKENPGDDGNETSPAEIIEYMPEFEIFFPDSLTQKHLYWREVSP